MSRSARRQDRLGAEGHGSASGGRAAVVVLALLVVVVGAIVWAMGDTGDGDPRDGEPGRGPDGSSGPARHADAAALPEGPEGAWLPQALRDQTVGRLDADERRPAAEPASGLGDRSAGDHALGVTAVDPDGDPVAGLAVVLAGVDESTGQVAEARFGTTDARGRLRLGLPAALVDQGVFRFPGLRLRLDVALPGAERRDLGREVVLADEQRLVVPRELLAWLEPVEVQVVDALGDPESSVYVGLFARRVDATEAAGQLVEQQISGLDGRAFLGRDHEALLRADYEGVRVESWVETLHERRPSDRVPVPALPDPGPVVLTLPPEGRVHVAVIDASGGPIDPTEPLQVRLELLVDADALPPTSRPGSPEYRPPGRPHEVVGRFIEEGRYLFSGVPLRTPFRISCRQGDGRPGLLEHDGLSAAGENLSLVVRTGQESPRLRGRFVDAEGAPLGALHADARIHDPASPGRDAPSVTAWADPRGHFDLALGPELDGLADPHVQFVLPEGWRRPRSLVAHLDLAGSEFEPGAVIEAGDVVFHPVPTLVAGQLRVGEGESVAGLALFLLDPHGGRHLDTTYLDEIEVDASGRFEAHGVYHGDELDLVVWDQTGVLERHRQRVAAGSVDVELVLESRAVESSDAAAVDGTR